MPCVTMPLTQTMLSIQLLVTVIGKTMNGKSFPFFYIRFVFLT